MKLFSEYSRFDLEQDILKCYDVCQNIENFLRKFSDDPKPLSEDEVFNIVNGIREVHSIQVDRLWDGFENMIKKQKFVMEQFMPDTEVEKEEAEIKPTKKRSSK
jgi:hypothetical protein